MATSGTNVNVGAQLTDQETTAAIAKNIDAAAAAYAPYAHTFNETHRRHLVRAGLKNLGFAEEVVKLIAQNPDLVPGYVGLDKLRANYDDYSNRSSVNIKVQNLAQGMSDGLLASGDNYMHDALAVYEYIKEGARRGDPACEVAYAKLKPRFEEQGKRASEAGKNNVI